MRCINARRISEAVGTAALVLLVLLPRGFCTRDDVSVTDPEDCDEASEGSTNGRGCGGGGGGGGHSHHATPEGNPAATNDSTGGGAPRPSRQQWMDRLRRKETWKNVLLQRLWHARRNASTVGGSQIVPRNMHTMTDLQDFKALLERGSPTHHNHPTTTNEQDTNAKNRIYLPHCSGPRNFTGNWNDGTNFRLYFNVEHTAAESSGAGHHRSGRETKVQSAYLYLKRKTTTTSVSPSRVTPTTAGVRSGRQPSGGDGQAVRGGQRGQTIRRRRPLRGVSDSSAPPPSPHPTPLDGGDSSGQLKVIVYLYSRPTKRARQGLETRSAVRTVPFSRNLTGWLRVNLTATVDDWSKRPQRNFGIQVTVQNEGGTTTTAEELHPGDYFDGFNCTEDQSHPAPVEFPLSTLEDTHGQSLVNDTVVDSDVNFTQPYLDVITTEVARSRSRFQRDLRAANSALHNA